MISDLPTLPAWHEDAACAGDDPELWFADDRTPWELREAKRICGECPVRTLCLDDAIARKERFGVWGGVDMGAPVRKRNRDNKAERLAARRAS